MTLRKQILALLALPFLALTAIGGLKALDDFSRLQNGNRTAAETAQAAALVKVIHHLQVERGLSAVFLTSAGELAQQELDGARAESDQAIRDVPAGARAVLDSVAGLQQTRTGVSTLEILPPQMASYYSGAIAKILEDVSMRLTRQSHSGLSQLGAGLSNLSQAKEAAGQQRAAGATGLGFETFSLAGYRKFSETGATEARFLSAAALSLRSVLPDLDLQAGLKASGVPEIRKAILDTAPYSPAPVIEPQEWFSRASDWISSLRAAEITIADAMIGMAGAEARNAMIALIITLIAVAVSLSISAVIGLKLIKSFTSQFGDLQSDLDKLARKEFEFEPSHLDEQNEIGELSRAMDITRTSLQEADEKLATAEADRKSVVQRLDSHMARLSQQDLECPIEEEFPAEYEELRSSFNTTVAKLKETITQVIAATGSIHNGANEISAASDDLSHRTESQAATLEETAAALEQLTASVKSAADGARDVEQTMQEARLEAEASGGVVEKAVSAMTEIETSSEKISQIISVIDDIAFQTNLLALNAGVEAARAGEAGKGFAVVASEVRALAQRSADAATEIKTLISDSSRQVTQGVDLVGETGEALASIVTRVNTISELVSNIAKGASEQSTGLSEINTGVNQLDQVTQQNAAMVEEATAAGHMLHTDAGKLASLMAEFKISGIENLAAPEAAKPARPEPAPAAPSAHGGDIDFGEPEPILAKAANAGGWEDF